MPLKQFGLSLEERGFEKKRGKTGVRYLGIGLPVEDDRP